MSLVRRAALRALLVRPARQSIAFLPICSTRVTGLSSTRTGFLRSFHQIRASWAESDNQTAQEQEKEEEQQVTSEPVGTVESVESVDSVETLEAPAVSEVAETSGAPAASNASVARTTSNYVQNDPEQQKRVIYAGNLFFETTEDDLKQLFSQHGEVEHVRVIMDSQGRSKGFGFVTMATEEQAETAIQGLSEQVFQGRRLMARKSNGPAPRAARAPREQVSPSEPTNTLFIGNLPRQMTDSDLNNLFAETMNVTDVRVAIDRRTGQPRGFAHADFLDVESATKAKEMLSGRELYGRWLKLDYGRSSADASRVNSGSRGPREDNYERRDYPPRRDYNDRQGGFQRRDNDRQGGYQRRDNDRQSGYQRRNDDRQGGYQE